MSQRLSEIFFPEGDQILQTLFPEAYSSILFPPDVAQKCPEIVVFATTNENNDNHATIFPPIRRPFNCLFAILGMMIMYYYAWRFWTLALVQLEQIMATTTSTTQQQQSKRRNVLLLFLWAVSFFFMGTMNVSGIFLHSLHPAPHTTYPKENPFFWICDTFCTGASLLTFYVASIILIWPHRRTTSRAGNSKIADANTTTPTNNSNHGSSSTYNNNKWREFLSSLGVQRTIGTVLFCYMLGLLAMIIFLVSSTSLYLELYYLVPAAICSAPWNIYMLLVWFKKMSKGKGGIIIRLVPPKGILLCLMGYSLLNGLHLDKFLCRTITSAMPDASLLRDLVLDSCQQMALIFAGCDCVFLGSAWLLLEREEHQGRISRQQKHGKHFDQDVKIKAT